MDTGVPRLKETPTPIVSPLVARHRATVGSDGGVFLMSEVPLYGAAIRWIGGQLGGYRGTSLKKNAISWDPTAGLCLWS